MSEIIKHALSTEKSIRLMESENKIVFIVDKKASKAEIKEELEKMFKAKVVKVNTFVDTRGRKKAYVKFSMETPAIDIAAQLGMM